MIGQLTAELELGETRHARKVIWEIHKDGERLQNLTRSSSALHPTNSMEDFRI